MAVLKNIAKFFSKSRLEYVELVLKIAAFLLGGYWTWYIFNYQFKVMPSVSPTSLSLTSEVIKAGKKDTLEFYELKIVVRNNTKERVKIPASLYNIIAYNVTINSLTALRFNEGIVSADSLFLNNFIAEDTSTTTIVQSDRLLTDNSIINPDGEFRIHKVFALPLNKFDIVTVNLFSASTKTSADVITDWYTDKYGKLLVTVSGIEKHLFGKNDTIPDHSGDFDSYAKNYDYNFTEVVNEYYIRNKLSEALEK